jgi:MAternally-affected-uncoordination protein
MQTVQECMSSAGSLIEHFNGTPSHKELLKVFFLVLQVSHYLMAGQVRLRLHLI